ncbi:hypothetical protein [Nocardia sp. NPDC019395]|uniref:hypothetical protein n=1 Tax=Nocardia sp. NPDC019395 TaxID=3154686 RepID=UPI0033F2946E
MTTESQRFPCPECGHQRTADHCWECDLDGDGSRAGVVDAVLTGLTTAALLPFLQGMATRSGEQAVPKLAGMFRRLRRRTPVADTGVSHLADVVVTDRQMIIRMPSRLSPEDARDLSELINSADRAEGWREISFDARTTSWRIAPTTEPPGANRLPPAG